KPVRFPSNTHPIQAPKGQVLERWGTDHRHFLFQIQAQDESERGPHCVGVEDIASSTRVGSVAPLGNTKEDDYYRNDSLKYCRHKEKKRKGKEMARSEPSLYTYG
ncbi:hypothetical protein QBC36DRAFT_157480, partial [Triangularia setosa]